MVAKGKFSTFLSGLLAGTALGTGICAAIALIFTNTPIPFVDKTEHSTVIDISNLDNKDPNEGLKEFLDQSGDKGDSLTTVEKVTAGHDETLPTTEAPTTHYQLRIGTYRTESAAQSICADLALKGIEADVIPITNASTMLYRVVIPVMSEREAQQMQLSLLDIGYKSTLEKSR